MRPVCVFANSPASDAEQLRASLRVPWRQAARAVMVLLSLRRIADAIADPASARIGDPDPAEVVIALDPRRHSLTP